MNKLSFRKGLLLMILLTVAISSTEAQLFRRSTGKKAEKGLFGNSLSKQKGEKIKEPKKVTKAKKKQEANKKKQDKEYKKAVERNRARSFNIQTTEVQERMNQNKKDTEEREKAKKKAKRENSRKGRKKYS